LTRRAVAADPLNPLMLYLDQWPYYFAREWEEVIARSDRFADLDPNYSEAYRLRAHALLHLGRHNEARRAAERTVDLSGRHPYQLNALAVVLARTGETEKARLVVAEMIARSENESLSLVAIATAQLALGDLDSFFQTMEQYYHTRGHWLSMLLAEPHFDPAGRDPRFLDLVRRVGIPGMEGRAE
jgi:tetratricopeptide (TPR) repeat protein